jgi:Domain of unknown function (DUF4893)
MAMTIRVPGKLIAVALTLAALAGPARADWHDQITRYDVHRLDQLEQSRARALQEAQRRGGTGDIGVVQRLFAPEPRSIPEGALAGTWRCRQVKLGGMTGYYVFDWFRCRITRVNGHLWFEKAGTQRMAGYLYPQQGMWVYLGAQSAMGEPIHRYSGQAASVGGRINPDDQVGVLVGIGNNRLRLDLPEPATQESDFDAIEFIR